MVFTVKQVKIKKLARLQSLDAQILITAELMEIIIQMLLMMMVLALVRLLVAGVKAILALQILTQV